MQTMKRASLLIALSVSIDTPQAAAADRRSLRVDDVFAFKEIGDPELSPDGAQVAYTVKTLDPKKDTSDTDVYLSSLDESEAVRLTASPKAETSPRFSPDGRY